MLHPWDFRFLWNLHPPDLKMDQILHPWNSEMSKISLPERSKKNIPLKSWFCTKKKAKIFRPPSGPKFFLTSVGFFKPQNLTPWKSKNLWNLPPVRFEKPLDLTPACWGGLKKNSRLSRISEIWDFLVKLHFYGPQGQSYTLVRILDPRGTGR